MRSLALALVLLAWGMSVRPAVGQSPTGPPPAADTRAAARLEHTRDDAAASCPDADALEEAVSRELGYRVFEREPATRVVRVTITGERRGLRAHVEVRDAQGTLLGERAIESKGRDCTELASTLTLAVGLALDPSYLLANDDHAEQVCPSPSPCPVCAPQQASDVEQASEARPREPLQTAEPSTFRGLFASVGLGLGVAALPAPSGGGIVQLAATWQRASLGLEGVLHPGVRGGELQAGAVEDPVRAELLRGQLSLCGRLPIAAAWMFDACGLGALGSLRGRGADTGVQDTSIAASAGVRAGFELALSTLFFAQARADVQTNFVRVTLSVDDMPAWTSPPFWGELSLLFGVRVF